MPSFSFDSSLTPDGRRLLEELNDFIDHPHAEEILLSDWLHDGSLPIPSPELIAYISSRLLTGPGIVSEVSALDRWDAAMAVVQAFRDEPPERRERSIENVRLRVECLRLIDSGKKGSQNDYIPEWMPILLDFCFPEDEEDSRKPAGVRSLARGILETMMLRAVFHMDAPRIEALGSALRIVRDNEEIATPNAKLIASRVIRFIPWLPERLGRLPTKEEFKLFLRTLYPDEMPQSRDEPFTNGFRLIGYNGPDNHRKKMDSNLIVRLALEVRKHEEKLEKTSPG